MFPKFGLLVDAPTTATALGSKSGRKSVAGCRDRRGGGRGEIAGVDGHHA
ncbi:hypothetical protein ACFQES_29705 [Nonomuraea salmonea]